MKSLIKEHLPALAVLIILLSFICGVTSIGSWTAQSPVLPSLGYENWVFVDDPHPVIRYLLSRPWHIIPLVFSSVSFLLISKVLITGKCAFLQGVKFGELVVLNFLVALFFITPMVIEISALLGGTAGAMAVAAYLIAGSFDLLSNKFNKACDCGVENINDTFSAQADNNSGNPKETAKIRASHCIAKKYPKGR